MWRQHVCTDLWTLIGVGDTVVQHPLLHSTIHSFVFVICRISASNTLRFGVTSGAATTADVELWSDWCSVLETGTVCGLPRYSQCIEDMTGRMISSS